VVTLKRETYRRAGSYIARHNPDAAGRVAARIDAAAALAELPTGRPGRGDRHL
jgi:hypothetical protein